MICSCMTSIFVTIDEEAIARMCNSLQKICQTILDTEKNNSKIQILKLLKDKKILKKSDDSLVRNY